jgi:hypothetical protein
MKRFVPLFVIGIIVLFFFSPFFFKKLLPVPADTIIGLYNPYRDLYAKEFPRGIPFKNFLITDPVRQLYPWRKLAIDEEKQLQLPLWNPYSFAGTPLLANFQSSPFYPLNIVFFVFPFPLAWSFLIILEPFLEATFTYLYLRKLRIAQSASLFGGIVFAFCGFSVAWMEWNSIIHTALFLPLILLSQEYLLEKITFRWLIVYILALICSILSGYVQILFYLILFINIYLLAKIFHLTYSGKNYKSAIKKIILFFTCEITAGILTVIQWFPTIQFILLSGRRNNFVDWHKDGWFLPFRHLAQFIAPDFFGNPTTLNYWGVWNYGELIGYVGILPLIFSLFALFYRRDKKTLFFGLTLLLSLLFSLPTPFAKIPFILNVPFLSTSQPTRLLFITDFSLSILAAYGLDLFLKEKKRIIFPLGILFLIFVSFWVFILSQIKFSSYLIISRQNMIFPTTIFLISAITILLSLIFGKKMRWSADKFFICLFIVIVSIDLLRFAQKFLPFTPSSYLFPQTRVLHFLEENSGNFRIMTTDSRIFPPNFSIVYKLQSLDGYDPLFISRYAELMASSEQKKPLTSLTYSRILTPHNFTSRIIDLFGVKYILTLTEEHNQKLTKVFQEGATRVYQNNQVFPRVFFVKNIYNASSKQEAESMLFSENFDIKTNAVVEEANIILHSPLTIGSASIIHYGENTVTIKTDNLGEGFLVLSDMFYPTWTVTVDGKKTPIILTDYALRGVLIAPGEHIINFSDSLF